jgi:mono/diheme cytochrome c family protein
MNAQVNHVVQGFLLALLLPAIGFILNKITSDGRSEMATPVIDYVEVNGHEVGAGDSYKGKNLFLQKCASCHQLFKESTGPALTGFEQRGPWSDRDKLHQWIKNPSLFMKNDLYTKKLKEKYGSMMNAFPDIRKEDVNAIAEYIVGNRAN